MIVGVIDDAGGRLEQSIASCPVELLSLASEHAAWQKHRILTDSDAVLLQVGAGMADWSLLIGALERLAARGLRALYVLADDVRPVEGLLDATSHWGDDAAALRTLRGEGRLVVAQADSFAADDVREFVERLVSEPGTEPGLEFAGTSD